MVLVSDIKLIRTDNYTLILTKRARSANEEPLLRGKDQYS